jgi:hypothetical protein
MNRKDSKGEEIKDPPFEFHACFLFVLNLISEYMLEIKAFGAPLLLQAEKQLAQLSEDESKSSLNEMAALWEQHVENELKLRRLWLKVRDSYRIRAGLPPIEKRKGPKAATFKIVDSGGVMPNQIRKGQRELAAFFSQTWATVIAKATEALQQRYPNEPEKWFIDRAEWRIFRL